MSNNYYPPNFNNGYENNYNNQNHNQNYATQGYPNDVVSFPKNGNFLCTYLEEERRFFVSFTGLNFE